jgi:uncharacterized membrane protein HdeD (DUF308 family)
MWVQRMVWVCIYSGLLSLVLGVFLARADMELARAIQLVGCLLVLIGAVLIYVRSRMKEPPSV